jgi:hypothetical protein
VVHQERAFVVDRQSDLAQERGGSEPGGVHEQIESDRPPVLKERAPGLDTRHPRATAEPQPTLLKRSDHAARRLIRQLLEEAAAGEHRHVDAPAASLGEGRDIGGDLARGGPASGNRNSDPATGTVLEARLQIGAQLA